ncbi:3-deoxy-7-phosphoheptulonate synthase, partial [Stenotrophomonas maltophilia]|uniref:3-deoxy-7-phosphoheptulonate synthase n=1 Tax=Stenotrophomonas maltophilia TaxID=40324 RepID=UPI00313B2FD3
LPYAQALPRQGPRQQRWLTLRTHYPGIGMRTAALDGAHEEYLRGERNPISIKVGPSETPDQRLRLYHALKP